MIAVEEDERTKKDVDQQLAGGDGKPQNCLKFVAPHLRVRDIIYSSITFNLVLVNL